MRLNNYGGLLGAIVLLLSQIALGQSRDYVVRSDGPDQSGKNDPVYPALPPKDDAVRPGTEGQTRVRVAPANRRGMELGVGLYVSPVPPAMSAQLRLRRNSGAVVESVIPGSPAEKAGIQQYDVIERIDGRPVKNPQQLPQLIAGHRAGDTIKLDIIREAKHQSIDVAIENLTPPTPFREFRPYQYQPQNQNQNQFPQNFNFKLSPDQTRQLDDLNNKLHQELQQQEKQIEQLKENLRREADHARQELQQLKDQIRREVEQQKKQLLDQVNKDKDKAKQDKDDDKQ